MSTTPIPPLEYTGERMVPESAGLDTFWEHIFRYRFARRFAAGRRVLDIACGEGYGSRALLDAGAAAVTGVDISAAACEHARRKYGIDAIVGDAEHIPFPDRSVDLIVSFETIEHVADPHRFLDECARVLDPAGTLVISTPEKIQYAAALGGTANPFHCSELTGDEFTNALRLRFGTCRMFSQCRRGAIGWWLFRFAIGAAPRFRVRGMSLVRGPLMRWLARRSARYRADPVRAILSPSSEVRPFSPFAVQPCTARAARPPIYLVAVARGVRRLDSEPSRAAPESGPAEGGHL